jgi:leader peptidase (prepilin peptidase)/N-methyltransferase
VMLNVLLQSTTAEVFTVIAFCFGLVVGSFLNVVILRLPKQLYSQWKEQSEEYLNLPQGTNDSPTETLLWPPSRCSKCGQAIKPWHNIPIISYILLKGRCATCSTPISLQYPLVELFTGIVVATTAYYYGAQLNAIYALFFSVVLIALAGIDVKEKLLPDQITLPLLWVGLIANLNGFFVPLSEAVIGAIAGYLVLWSVYWVFKLITGKEGMGYGDFKLLAALGAWLGWQMLPLIILVSSAVGAIIGILMIVVGGKDRNLQIPFGPFLAAAGWIALIWGDKIINSYSSAFSVL